MAEIVVDRKIHFSIDGVKTVADDGSIYYVYTVIATDRLTGIQSQSVGLTNFTAAVQAAIHSLQQLLVLSINGL